MATGADTGRGRAVGFAVAALLLGYGLGALFLDSALWFTDLRSWWLVLITLVVAGLLYYQARHDLLD